MNQAQNIPGIYKIIFTLSSNGNCKSFKQELEGNFTFPNSTQQSLIM